MTKVAIVYHSGYGHTKKQADAVRAGVLAADSAAELIAIDAEGNIPESAWDMAENNFPETGEVLQRLL